MYATSLMADRKLNGRKNSLILFSLGLPSRRDNNSEETDTEDTPVKPARSQSQSSKLDGQPKRSYSHSKPPLPMSTPNPSENTSKRYNGSFKKSTADPNSNGSRRFGTDINVSVEANALDDSVSHSVMGWETIREDLVQSSSKSQAFTGRRSSSCSHATGNVSATSQPTQVTPVVKTAVTRCNNEVPTLPPPSSATSPPLDDPVAMAANGKLPAEMRDMEWFKLPDKERTRWFMKLGRLGQGGFSEVYKVLSIEDKETYALKEIKVLDPAIRQTVINETKILRKLSGLKHIIQMKDYFLDKVGNRFYILMELGSMDLSSVIKTMHSDSFGFQSIWTKKLWSEMLLAVQAIHNENIVHSDLKPANFLLFGATLKLIDFGISNRLHDDATSIQKDIRCGTFNYMAPETLQPQTEGSQTFKVGRYTDVWSLGCILYLMLYQKTPFQDIANAAAKFFAIVSKDHVISYPQHKDTLAVDSIRMCLQRDCHQRATVSDLLKHNYLIS